MKTQAIRLNHRLQKLGHLRSDGAIQQPRFSMVED